MQERRFGFAATRLPLHVAKCLKGASRPVSPSPAWTGNGGLLELLVDGSKARPLHAGSWGSACRRCLVPGALPAERPPPPLWPWAPAPPPTALPCHPCHTPQASGPHGVNPGAGWQLCCPCLVPNPVSRAPHQEQGGPFGLCSLTGREAANIRVGRGPLAHDRLPESDQLWPWSPRGVWPQQRTREGLGCRDPSRGRSRKQSEGCSGLGQGWGLILCPELAWGWVSRLTAWRGP